MRTNQSKLRSGLVAACLVVGLVAVGCGDDADDGTPMAGTGGSGGSAGGAGTAAGSGGSGGRAGGGGGGGTSGGPSIPECISKTTTKLGGSAAAMTCSNCVCNKAPKLATDCVNTVDCWDLILCAGKFMCTGASQISCLMTNCPTLIDDTASTTAATAFGTPIVRMMCGNECLPPAGDAGTADAGM